MSEDRKRWDDAVRWADDYLDRNAREAEHLTDEEIFDRNAISEANLLVMRDAWVIAHPDDPTMRAYLIQELDADERFADAVLARMREIGAELGLA
jgi:hypothetical protein